MWRANQSAITNILHDQPFEWGNQLYYLQRQRQKILFVPIEVEKSQQLQVPKLGQLMTFNRKKLDDRMDEEVNLKLINLYKFEYTYVRFWNLKFGVHRPILGMVKIHWLDDECLSIGLSNANFDVFLVKGLAALLQMIFQVLVTYG